MAYNGMKEFAALLEREGELVRCTARVDPVLEITEIADRFSKQPGGGKALLFEDTGSPFPLLINALGSERRMALALGRPSLEEIGEEINTIFRGLVSSKTGWWDKLSLLPLLGEMASWMPKKVKGRGRCQEVVMDPPDLGLLPVLQCWPADGGRFITLPAVHTLDPDTGAPNTGMYRMQLFGGTLTGMHWHRHKTGANHYEKYKSLGRRMPVTVTLGGDPSYVYAATAPMPENMDEYLLAGFLRKKQVRLVQCLTNALWVPCDVDFVIEGYVDPGEELIWEGPFGDHTGFYSLADYYPRFHVTCITHRRDAVYPATIVGVPPMEDAWIGKATERIFTTPIRLTMIPELVDMDLPFAGVAHNLSVVKINKSYPGQAVKVMHALWGAGQMMFNKILVVADSDADVHDYQVMAQLFARWFDPEYSLHFSRGPLDVLDHSSQLFAYGSKVGIDLTAPLPGERPAWTEKGGLVGDHPGAAVNNPSVVSVAGDASPWCTERASPGGDAREAGTSPHTGSLASWASGDNTDPEWNNDGDLSPFTLLKGVTGAALVPSGLQADGNTSSRVSPLPVLLLTVDKKTGFSLPELVTQLSAMAEAAFFKAILLYDEGVPLGDLFTLVWLLGGNMEPQRDIRVVEFPSGKKGMVVDATIKTPGHDHFSRDWPNIVTMDSSTIDLIDQRWPSLGVGDPLPSPSLKYHGLVRGGGAVRES